jgi:hypothetical protein
VRAAGVVDVLSHCHRHRRGADGLAYQPANALQGERGVGRIGEGLVLLIGGVLALVEYLAYRFGGVYSSVDYGRAGGLMREGIGQSQLKTQLLA